MKNQEIRQKLHSMAEKSGEEFQTSKFLIDNIQKFQPSSIQKFQSGNHFLVEYDFGGDEAVLFRADMDAVGVQESTSPSYHSVNQGVSHKCGHDGHSTILLHFAELLHLKPLKQGKILLLFQGAEETGTGAKQILQDTVLQQYNIVSAFALHNIPQQPLHSIICREESFTCSVISCEILLDGKTSHASEPWNSVSPYQAAISITDKVLSLNCHDIESERFCVATLIEFSVGSCAYGVAAGNGVLRFTIRTKFDSHLQTLKSNIEKWVKETVSSVSGLSHKISWIEYFAAAQNSKNSVELVKRTANQLNLNYINKPFPFFWGEDFGLFTQHYKGALFGLGSGTDQPPLHHPDFDFPDEIIETGAKMFYQLAENIFNKDYNS